MKQTYYMQLKPIVIPYLECYKADFTDYDKKGLRQFTGNFLYGMRPTGTNLLKFGGDKSADDMTTVPGFSSGPVGELIEYFLFRANDRFFHGHNGTVKEITEQKARSIYQLAKRHGVKFFM